MKFGDTLRSRSIPEWGHYNIDYDYLKDLIKHQTTPGTNKAVSIPGQGESTELVFRDTFLQVLQVQHDRINLFIRSKSGEIERRLDHITKTLSVLLIKQRHLGRDVCMPARTVEKYAKLDADISKIGEEIRSLSRFQVAQRTGFVKIMKKYKRWTKDRSLGQDFKEQISSRPDSLFQLDLGYLLDQYIDALSGLRSLLDGNGASSVRYTDANSQSSAGRISRALLQYDELEFDLALTTVPLGSNGNKATYWIHPDHVVEAQLLLFQHMKLYSTNARQASRNGTSYPTPIRRQSSSATTERYFGKEDDVCLVVLDHAEAFAIKQNASTIISSEATKGFIGMKASGNVRCVSTGKAAVVICPENESQQQSANSILTARVGVRSLQSILDTTSQAARDDYDSETSAIRKWLAEHKKTKPIAGIGAKRTRFIGLHNNSAGGVWATLDKDVFMKASLDKDLVNDDWPSVARQKGMPFPHAILEVRREGAQATSLIQALDRSHLLERVRGFSVEAHAVWSCCKPSFMTAPFWMPLLDQDIRKLPEPTKRMSRKSKHSTVGSTSQSSPPQTSSSNTSHNGQVSPVASRAGDQSASSVQDFVDPPSLQAFRKKSRKPYSDYPPPMSPVIQEHETPRYWNEYDHPEDEDTGGYYIYVDPDAAMKFPGQDMFEAWTKKARKILGIQNKADDASLLSAEDSTDDEDMSDDSPLNTTAGYGTMPQAKSASTSNDGYFSGLFRTLRDPYRDAEALEERRTLLTELEDRRHRTEMAKLRFYLTCLTMAVVLDLTLGMMIVTSRKKERGVVDVGVLIGIICTLMLCVVSVISMKTRREILGWVHQGAVLSIAAAVIALDILLLSWILRV